MTNTAGNMGDIIQIMDGNSVPKELLGKYWRLGKTEDGRTNLEGPFNDKDLIERHIPLKHNY